MQARTAPGHDGPAPHSGAPNLREAEHEEVQERTDIGVGVFHEAIPKEGEAELARPSSG